MKILVQKRIKRIHSQCPHLILGLSNSSVLRPTQKGIFIRNVPESKYHNSFLPCALRDLIDVQIDLLSVQRLGTDGLPLDPRFRRRLQRSPRTITIGLLQGHRLAEVELLGDDLLRDGSHHLPELVDLVPQVSDHAVLVVELLLQQADVFVLHLDLQVLIFDQSLERSHYLRLAGRHLVVQDVHLRFDLVAMQEPGDESVTAHWCGRRQWRFMAGDESL